METKISKELGPGHYIKKKTNPLIKPSFNLNY